MPQRLCHQSECELRGAGRGRLPELDAASVRDGDPHPIQHLRERRAGALGARRRRPDWRPLSVDFDHRELPCAEEYRKTFGERVRFSQPVNVLVLDKLSLVKAMPTADAALYAILSDLADRWLAELAEEPEVPDQVADEIATRLKSGTADLEHVADGAGLRPRALQWRLEQSGTSFEKLLNETRAHIAEHLLRDTDRSLTDIAFDLGLRSERVHARRGAGSTCRRGFTVRCNAAARSRRPSGLNVAVSGSVPREKGTRA